jgi:hypothetical protein
MVIVRKVEISKYVSTPGNNYHVHVVGGDYEWVSSPEKCVCYLQKIPNSNFNVSCHHFSDDEQRQIKGLLEQSLDGRVLSLAFSND